MNGFLHGWKAPFSCIPPPSQPSPHCPLTCLPCCACFLRGTLQEIPRDFAVFMREYLAGANRVSSYFLARTVAELPFQVHPVIPLYK